MAESRVNVLYLLPKSHSRRYVSAMLSHNSAMFPLVDSRCFVLWKLNSFSPSQRVLAEKNMYDVMFDIEIRSMETPTHSPISWSSNRMHVYPHQTISSRSSSASDSSFEAASPLLQRQTFYQEDQFDNMSSLVYPSGNRAKSPANRLLLPTTIWWRKWEMQLMQRMRTDRKSITRWQAVKIVHLFTYAKYTIIYVNSWNYNTNIHSLALP